MAPMTYLCQLANGRARCGIDSAGGWWLFGKASRGVGICGKSGFSETLGFRKLTGSAFIPVPFPCR